MSRKHHAPSAAATRRARLLATSVLGLALAGGSAYAQGQTAPPLGGGTSSMATLEEVVVTAQKRAESAQDVPIAITALNAEAVLNTGVTDTQDLKAAVPALNFTTGTAGFGLPRIRGVGATGQGSGIENPVAVYVDGVYYGASFGVLQSLFDVEQVAVLKGPQGTLFGRNATGGLIQITTQGPSFEPRGKMQAGYGSYATSEAAFFITGGLTDTLAASLSAQVENREEGYGKNLFTGNDIQSGDTYAGRAKLLWQPTEETSLLLSGDFNGRRATEPAPRNFALNTLGQDVNQQIRSLGGNLERDIIADVDPNLRSEGWGTSAILTHDFAAMQFKSISAYRHTELDILFDPDGTTLPRTRIFNDYTDKQFTQEFNLVSLGDGPLQWVLGAFYMWNDSQAKGQTTGTILFPADNGTSDNLYGVGLKSLAGFAELTWSVTDRTRLVGGVRYTKDERDYWLYNVRTVPGLVTVGPRSADSREFDATTYRLSVDHRLSDAFMVYASYNRGFRAGTFVAAGSPVITLRPETVDAYEVGIKSDLFDRRVRLNAAGYYYDQTNVQVMQVIAGVQNVYNAGGADVYGVDADITWQVAENVRVFGGINYTKAEYKGANNATITVPFPLPASFVIPAGQSCQGTFGNPRAQLGGNCLLPGNIDGRQLQNTPLWTVSVGGTWNIPTSAGDFLLAGNYYYNDGFPGSADERVSQPSYNTLDASLTWKHPDEHLSVRLWGKNLTDEWFRTQLSASNTGDNGTNAPPRTYGLTVGYEF